MNIKISEMEQHTIIKEHLRMKTYDLMDIIKANALLLNSVYGKYGSKDFKMKIKTTHHRISKLKVCAYCFKSLNTKLEIKRSVCFSCNEKYNIKSKLTKWL